MRQEPPAALYPQWQQSPPKHCLRGIAGILIISEWMFITTFTIWGLCLEQSIRGQHLLWSMLDRGLAKLHIRQPSPARVYS